MKINPEDYKPRLEEYLIAKGVNTSGTNVQCIEPNHPDNNPSASITEADRLKCHSCGSNEDIFGCAGILIGQPGKENFKYQLADVQKTLGGFISEQVKPKKAARKKTDPVKFISLPRKEALEIYNPKKILEMAEYVTKKTVVIPEHGWYPYYNEKELIDIMTVRFNHDDGKDILTFYYDGKHIKMKAYPVLLYNRHFLKQRPGDPVIIHEGEKCANIAGEKLPDFVHTTWNGGGKKFKYIQGLEVLKDRDVYLFPDDDQKKDLRSGKLFAPDKQPGMKTMIELKNILEKI